MFLHFLKNIKPLKNNPFNFKGFVKKAIWKFWLVCALLLTVPSFYSLIKPGYFPMQDDMQAFKIYEIDKCFYDFQVPCRWSQNSGYGYGEPVFNFYSPFTYYLGEGVHILGFQFVDSVKIVFILGFLLSTLFTYLLVSELFGPFAGFVGSLLYTYAPIRAQEVYVRGSLPEFFAVTLIPLVLFLSYKLIKEKSSRNIAWLSISLGILFLTHNLTTFMFLPIFFVWIIFWLWQEKKWNLFPAMLLSGILGLSLSAFFILPMVVEKGYVHLDSILTGYFDYRRHFLSFKQIFFSNDWGYGSSDLGDNDNLALNSGSVLMLLGFLAFPLSLFHLKKVKKFFYLTLILGTVEIMILFLMHSKSEFIYRLFPVLIWLQFPWRFLTISILILTLLSGLSLNFLGKLKYFFGFLAILTMFILHGSFFHPMSWSNISDNDKFSGTLWEKQLTISIFDYLPRSATLPPNKKAPFVPEILSGDASIVDYQKGSFFQTGTISAIINSVIRVPLIDFPGMTVYVDGRKAEHYVNCEKQEYCFGLITFEVEKGNHNILIKLEKTPIREIGEALSFLGFVIVLLLIFTKKYVKNN